MSDDFGYLMSYDYRNRRMVIQDAKDNTKKIAELPVEALHKSQSHDERRNVREAYSCVAITGKQGNEKIITYNTQNSHWTEWKVKRKLVIPCEAGIDLTYHHNSH